ncbi:MAG: hypothetical protein IKM08_08055 [Clostridia bacterium]|nr:hypothetical protein [Clostridia bacterium]
MPVRVGLQYIAQWKDSMEKAVQAYEAQPTEQGRIVFYGPSYFTRWSEKWGMVPLEEEIVGKSGKPCCINRGFGSSCAEHQLYYYDRMVKPLAPKVLVYSSFGNSMDFGYSPEETFELAQRVVIYTLTDFPDCQVYICGTGKHKKIIPIEGHDEGTANYDKWLQEFAKNTPNCHYIDPKSYAPLVTDMDKIFVEDGVHYNQEGYRRFGAFFREALKDELEKF